MSNTQIKLELTVEQVNTVLEALGNLPYAKAEPLIAEIQQQAASQLNGDSQ